MRMRISQSIQIPKDNMFTNGVMSQAWYMFFYALSQAASQGEEVDTRELLQLASQLPSSTYSSKLGESVDSLERQTPCIPILQFSNEQPMPTTSVFLCPNDNPLPLAGINHINEQTSWPTTQITNEMQVIINGNN